MQIVLDGYNKSVAVGRETLVFRPMIQSERDQLAELLRSSSEETYDGVQRMFVLRHIVYWSGQQLSAVSKIVEGDSQEEERDVDNLYHGTILQVRYPHLGIGFDCKTCREQWFLPLEGKFAKGGHPRPDDMPVPCETQMPCPRGHYSNPTGLTAKNAHAFRHYRRCLATGSFPDDMIVQRNAAVIRKAINDAQRGVDPATGKQPRE